jgi:hypothetical protein
MKLQQTLKTDNRDGCETSTQGAKMIERLKSLARHRGLIMAPILVAAFAAIGPVHAHHSFAKFDQQSSIEIEGEVTEVRWQNPHIRFTVLGAGADGRVQTWNLETNSPGILRRSGIVDGLVAVGDHVRVAGNPAVNGGPEMNATNMLLPDGRELQLGPNVPLRFAGRGVSDGGAWAVTVGDSSRPELGIFRVWSSTIASAFLLFTDASRPGFTVLDYPLTAAARRAVEAFDPVAGSRRLANDCTPKGMPWIMEQPYDLMFERDGDDILLKVEEFDVVRRIHMDWSGDRAAQASTIHGFSTGVWEEGTLVVTTTNLNSPNFKFEVPQSTQATILERFTPSADGAKLDYEIVVTDPVTFTEPVRMEKYWISIPSQAFDAYNCGAPLTP